MTEALRPPDEVEGKTNHAKAHQDRPDENHWEVVRQEHKQTETNWRTAIAGTEATSPAKVEHKKFELPQRCLQKGTHIQ